MKVKICGSSLEKNMSQSYRPLVVRQTGFEPDEPQPLGEEQYTITATRLASEGNAI